jgi:microcystin-dependent protein
MSQNDMSIANQAGAPFRADLNNALQAGASLSSGATEPATMYAYQLWYDTTAALLKIRNGANNAWVVVGPLADSTKHEIYVGGTKRFDIDSNGYVVITATNAIKLPSGTTAQRPSPVAGQIRFNSTNNQFEGYNGTDWVIMGGDTSSVGTIELWPMPTLPPARLWANGGAVSRTTFAALFAAYGTFFGSGDGSTTFNLPNLCGCGYIGADNMGGVSAANRIQVSTTISTTSTSTAATVASATGLCAGMYVHSANVPAGTTIASISGTNITLSAAATGTASGTAARFSVINDPQTFGSIGGSQTHTLVTAQIPSHTHTVTNAGRDSTLGSYIDQASSTGESLASNAINNTGGDQPHPNLQPSFVGGFVVKY